MPHEKTFGHKVGHEVVHGGWAGPDGSCGYRGCECTGPNVVHVGWDGNHGTYAQVGVVPKDGDPLVDGLFATLDEADLAVSGQSHIKAKLEEFGWAVVLNSEHDLGTDLWISPRDPRRFDPGLMLGAQVKNGESWFSEVGEKDGRRGWWHRNDRAPHSSCWSVVPTC